MVIQQGGVRMSMNKMLLKKYITSLAKNLRLTLARQISLTPTQYNLTAHNSKRIIVLGINNIPTHRIRPLSDFSNDIGKYIGLGDAYPIRVTWGINQSVQLEIAKPVAFYEKVGVQDLEFDKSKDTIPLGIDILDKQIELDFQDPMTTHVLLSGQTQSGKTNALKYMIWAITKQNPDAKLMIFDTGDGVSFDGFENHPSLLLPITKTSDDAMSALDIAKNILADRNNTGNRLFIIADELRHLLKNTSNGQDTLSEIAAMGAKYRIHLILATQHPQKQLLGGRQISELIDNLTTRLSGKVITAMNSNIALGLPGLGAEKLTGHGEFLINNHHYSNRFLFPFFDGNDLIRYPEREYSIVDGPLQRLHNQGGRPNKAYTIAEFENIISYLTVSLISTQGNLSQRGACELIKTTCNIDLNRREAKQLMDMTKRIIRETWQCMKQGKTDDKNRTNLSEKIQKRSTQDTLKVFQD